ncbi:hypothetical protein AB1E33_15550 [Ruegeria sp. 2012CJ15-1]
MFWGFVILGAVVSNILSIVAHYQHDIPRGVPLARLGTMGAVTQVFLMVLPLIIASVLVGFVRIRRDPHPPARDEIKGLTKAIAMSALVLCLAFWILSGAWFGLVQAPVWAIPLIVFGPILGVAIIFWLVFSMTTHLLR